MSATAIARKPVRSPMQVSVYLDNGQFGFWYSSGPVMHRHGGFATEALAQAAGLQARAETLAYAHRFEPRAQVMFDSKTGARYVTGWTYKCACGLEINPVFRPPSPDTDGRIRQITDDSGPCPAAVQVKARAA